MSTFGQNKTWLGPAVGFKWVYFQSTETGSLLCTYPIPGELFVMTLTHELNKNLRIETGLIRTSYYTGFSFAPNGHCFGGGFGRIMQNWLIPLRIKYRKGILRNKIGITPHLGTGLIRNLDLIGYQRHRGGAISGEVDTIWNIQSFSNAIGRNFILLETGISFDVIIGNSFMLYLLTNYQAGFKRMIDIDVNYTDNSGPQTGEVYTNGNNLQYVLGLKYAISNLWQATK